MEPDSAGGGREKSPFLWVSGDPLPPIPHATGFEPESHIPNPCPLFLHLRSTSPTATLAASSPPSGSAMT